MKNSYLFASLMWLVSSLFLHAAIESPQPSPLATVKQRIGVTDVEVVYSRPSVKDREIFGKLVPFDEIWRTGANAPTKITFGDPVVFGGQPVPAGQYALYTIPGTSTWTVIVYGDTSGWGSAGYSAEKDVARVIVKPTKLAQAVETFTIGFDYLRDDSANLHLDWEHTRVSVPVLVPTRNKTMAAIDEAMKDPASLKPGDYANAAVFYLEHDGDPNLAATWMAKALASRPDAFWLVHQHARILAKQGKKAEAVAEAKRSIELAKANKDGDFGYIARNEELLQSLQ